MPIWMYSILEAIDKIAGTQFANRDHVNFTGGTPTGFPTQKPGPGGSEAAGNVGAALGSAQTFTGEFILFLLVCIGLVIAADYAPAIVNGVLILILLGIVLRNAGEITQALGSAK
jgi:hypothetical protein